VRVLMVTWFFCPRKTLSLCSFTIEYHERFRIFELVFVLSFHSEHLRYFITLSSNVQPIFHTYSSDITYTLITRNVCIVVLFYSMQNSLNLKVLFCFIITDLSQCSFTETRLESSPNWRGIQNKSTWVHEIYSHLNWGRLKTEFNKRSMNLTDEN